MRVATSETGAAWNEFFANPVARGLAGRSLGSPPTLTRVSCDRGEPLPGAVWQRCRTHYAAKLMPVTPKSLWSAVKSDAALRLRPTRRHLGPRPVRPTP